MGGKLFNASVEYEYAGFILTDVDVPLGIKYALFGQENG